MSEPIFIVVEASPAWLTIFGSVWVVSVGATFALTRLFYGQRLKHWEEVRNEAIKKHADAKKANENLTETINDLQDKVRDLEESLSSKMPTSRIIDLSADISAASVAVSAAASQVSSANSLTFATFTGYPPGSSIEPAKKLIKIADEGGDDEESSGREKVAKEE